MNAKEIQDMAYKAKFWTADTSFGGVCWMGYHAELQRFAELIAAHEPYFQSSILPGFLRASRDICSRCCLHIEHTVPIWTNFSTPARRASSMRRTPIAMLS